MTEIDCKFRCRAKFLYVILPLEALVSVFFAIVACGSPTPEYKAALMALAESPQDQELKAELTGHRRQAARSRFLGGLSGFFVLASLTIAFALLATGASARRDAGTQPG